MQRGCCQEQQGRNDAEQVQDRMIHGVFPRHTRGADDRRVIQRLLKYSARPWGASVAWISRNGGGNASAPAVKAGARQYAAEDSARAYSSIWLTGRISWESCRMLNWGMLFSSRFSMETL